MLHISLFLALACLPFVAIASDVSGKIQWNSQCPDIISLRPSKVILDNGRMRGSILQDGSFNIPDVPVGTYVLSVVASDHEFDQLRIDIVESEPEPQVRPHAIGTPLEPPSTRQLPYPIVLTPKSKHVFFMPHESFNVLAMLSSPMAMMMILGGAMMLGMPSLMKNVDPEALEEFKEQHAKVKGFQTAVASGDIKTGLSTFMGDNSKPGSGKSNQSTTKSRGNKNRRR